MIKYPLDTIFKDNHNQLYMVVKTPTHTVRKDKKIVFIDENYTLLRIPDKIEYKSKYDSSDCRHTFPELKVAEVTIDANIARKNWIII